MPWGLLRRLRFWVVAYLCVFSVAAYSLIPKRTDMWLQVRIRNQTWDALKEVQLAVADRFSQVLATAKLDLSTSYDSGMSQLLGSEGWCGDVAEKILEASNNGLL